MVAEALPNRNVKWGGRLFKGFPYTTLQIFCQDLPKLAEI
jgi:hypothetical protein